MGEPVNKLDTILQIGRSFGVRDGMLRLGYELKRGSGLMSWKMRSVEEWESWKLEQIAPGTTEDEILTSRRDGGGKFFFDNCRTLAPTLREILGPEGEAEVLNEAEDILEGRLPFFGALSFDCKFPPRWFENPVTGESVSPQQSWTQMRFASPVYGDLKFILEPSRFLFVYPLVRAYALTGQEKFAEGFWRAVENWAEKNPPMAGPLWICGQEASLRILAWTFALHGFIHSESTTPERITLLFSMIAAHAWRTAQTLGYARSQRSNHLISEAVGLWTAGTLYPELREAAVWQTLGAQLLQEAVLDQITLEGASQQHSFNYQRMILHQLLWTLRLAEIYGVPLHPDIRERTNAAHEFMQAWFDPVSGLVPNYGSDDGSLIFPLASGAYRDFRPLVQLGAAVLGRTGLPPGKWDESAVWFGVEPPKSKKNFAESFSRAGYFRLGDQDSWAMIRAGRYSRRPFQADQLHMDLWWKGVNFAVDAGTYLYNGPAPWNNGFAGTGVHNTVTVDGGNQMRRAGRFLWLDWAQASGRLYSSAKNATLDCFEGEHDGYKRLGVTHRRQVRWLPGHGWVVVDDVIGTGARLSRLHWLLADLSFAVDGSQVDLDLQGSTIRWNIFCNAEGQAELVRTGKRTAATGGCFPLSDDEAIILGWQATTYGDLQPGLSLLYEVRAELPMRLVTVVLTDRQCRVESREGAVVISREGTILQRVELTATSAMSLANNSTQNNSYQNSSGGSCA